MNVAVRKRRKTVPVGIIHINSSFNNTVVTITDLQGDVIATSSAGQNGFKGSRKSTPYAAQVAAEKALEKAKDYGLKTVSIKIKGPGAGRESAVRVFSGLKDITVTSINDVTPIPHNGCRAPKRRRV